MQCVPSHDHPDRGHQRPDRQSHVLAHRDGSRHGPPTDCHGDGGARHARHPLLGLFHRERPGHRDVHGDRNRRAAPCADPSCRVGRLCWLCSLLVLHLARLWYVRVLHAALPTPCVLLHVRRHRACHLYFRRNVPALAPSLGERLPYAGAQDARPGHAPGVPALRLSAAQQNSSIEPSSWPPLQKTPPPATTRGRYNRATPPAGRTVFSGVVVTTYSNPTPRRGYRWNPVF